MQVHGTDAHVQTFFLWHAALLRKTDGRVWMLHMRSLHGDDMPNDGTSKP